MPAPATVLTLHDKRQHLAARGIQRNGRPVPFGITLQPLELPPGTGERIRSIGNTVGVFLRGLSDLVLQPEFSHLRAAIPELRLLQRPETRYLRDIGPLLGPSMFRLDLIIQSDGGFQATEIELLCGGLGFKHAIRQALFPASAEKSIARSFARMLTYLSEGTTSRCSIIAPSWPALSFHVKDLALFADDVHAYYPNYDLVYADDLRLRGDDLISTRNAEPIRLVHRSFEIYMATRRLFPNVDLIEHAYRQGTARDIPCYKQPLEEKLAFALVSEPRLSAFFTDRLTAAGYQHIQALLPKTYHVTPQTIIDWRGLSVPVMPQHGLRLLGHDLDRLFPEDRFARADAVRFVQASPRIAALKRPAVISRLLSGPRVLNRHTLLDVIQEAAAVLCLATIPRRQRKYVLKLSGFDEDAAGAKSVVFVNKLTAVPLEAEMTRALQSGKLYVLQEMSPHHQFTLSGLVPRYLDYLDSRELTPTSLEFIDYHPAYARVEPMFFHTGPRQWELGDIFVTVTPDKRTHGRSDSIATVAAY